MRDFWSLARGMFKYRTRMVLAIVFAILGASGMGVGLLGAAPVLQTILNPKSAEAKTLPVMVSEVNAKIGHLIPAEWIASLPTGKFTAVVWVVVALAVITVFGELCNFLHGYLSMTVVTRTIADVRERVFRHIVHLPMRVLMQSGPSNQLTRVVNDCGELGGGMNNLLGKAIAQVFKAVAAVIVAFMTHWVLALIAIPTALCLGAVIRYTGVKIRKGARKGLQARGNVLQTAG